VVRIVRGRGRDVVVKVAAVVRMDGDSGEDVQAKMIENAPCKMMLRSQHVVRLPLRYSVMPPPPQCLDRGWALHERDRDRRI
jgi:hypothetical protein